MKKKYTSPYAQSIRETLAKIGLVGKYKPEEIEAWMRLEHGCLDGLSARQFEHEVKVATECIDAWPAFKSMQLAKTYGL